MPAKHKDSERWGGPGASHEDRTEAKPDKVPGTSQRLDRQTNRSSVSGGGGERDKHHSRDSEMKGDRSGR